MRTRVPQHSQSKHFIGITKKANFIMLFSAVIIGIAIGYSFQFILGYHESTNHNQNTAITSGSELSKIATSSDTANTKYINPLTSTNIYDNFNFAELDDFKGLLNDYISKAEKEKSVSDIAIYFRDLNNGLSIGINEKEKFELASLNKIPIMIAAFKKEEESPGFLNSSIVYNGSPEQRFLALHPEIDMPRTTLEVNKNYTVNQLIEYMIKNSDNESTLQLINTIGLDYLRYVKDALGMLHYKQSEQSSSIISLKSYSTYFRILYNSSFLNQKFSNKALALLSQADFRDGMMAGIPSDIMICHKYGERDSIMPNNNLMIKQLNEVGIVYFPGKPYLLGIMIRGDNKSFMKKILSNISGIVYREVSRQMGHHLESRLEKDIEKD
jgi:beta-lactamase class A